MQILSVAFGGTLEQHIDSGAHTNPGILADHRFVRHAVSVDPFSRLASAFGDEVVRPVSSAHHQRIDRVGEGLRIVARAADSTIEAIEGESAPVLGVQWHPEDPSADIEPLRRLLAALEPGSVDRSAPVLSAQSARRHALVA